MSDRWQELLDRVRPGQRGSQARQPRRLSRRERELRQRRLLYISMFVVTALVVLLLGGGAIYEYVVRPREVLATVNGTHIRRGDYWKMRRYSLLNQIQQYQFFAAQNPQYRNFIDQLARELKTYKTAPVDAPTLNGMIDDTVVVQRVKALGVTISDQELQQYVQESFAPIPLGSPTPSPAVNPTAAAWATQTASARAASPTRAAAPGTPGTPGTPGAAGTATRATTPSAAGTPATPGTPGTPGTPSGTPGTPPRTPGAPTPTPTETPSREQALATSTATYGQYLKSLDEEAGMSRDDYVRLVARPGLAKQKAQEQLSGQVQDVQPQVHAAHILLATRDGADQARRAVTQEGKDFAEIARQQSTDTGTAPNGGDLGWFPKGMMVEEFEEVAFALQPGQISEPVQSKFGWHVIKVIERDDARPLALETYNQLKDGAYQKWLDGQKASSTITSKLPATPTPPAEQFEAPPGAPPTPVPTPAPPPTRPASPAASPSATR